MNQGFDYWYGLPDSHDMRMTAPRANGLKSAPHDLRAPLTGAGPSPRRVLFYYWDNELRAVRKGP